MLIRWAVLFILMQYIFVNCDEYLCNYIVNKSDNTTDMCISYECNKFIDPYSIMVIPNNCKTKILYLAFSSYKNFNLFLNRIKWKLGDLFPLKLNNYIRLLRIYIKNIDFDDKPIDFNQLIRLGINIDLYQLYLQNIPNNNSLYELIHYDSNDPQWDIINVRFFCNPLMRFDENPCSTQIISPSLFAPRRSTVPIKTIPLLSISSSTKQSIKKSNNLIIIILIPLLIVLISIIIIIYIIRKRYSNRNLTSITPRSSSIQSISNNLDSKNGSYAECRPSAKPYQISRLPSPHKDSLYKEVQRNF